jgi:membrane peptidoglycan carboxypeptidase
MQAVQNELENTYGYTPQQIDGDGLKIVTTFNESMMTELYRSVAQVKQMMRDDGQPLPEWAHIGAVLEKPGTGAILAMYAGPGYNARHCEKIKCQFNTALEARNQVGSSFKPYVLATAVHQGMNVQTSELDGYASICTPSDRYPRMLSVTVSGTACPDTPYGWYNFQSVGESNGPVSVVKASALSLNTAYGDLIHRVGTQNVINMAKAFGVNTSNYPAGSSLQAMVGQSGIALGQASLTVEEQATTFATLADNGVYYTPHVIAKLTQGDRVIPLRIQSRQVLTPTQAADVDYALSFDTVYGTAYPNGVLNPVRPTIAKTGTTNVAQDAFFIGAIPQYSLAVGMFTTNQNQRPGGQTLNVLPTINGQAGGYGGAWPTTLWRTYMTNELNNLPVKPLPTPNFAGFAKWVQAPPPPLKPKHPQQPRPSPSCQPGHHQPYWHRCAPPSPSPGPHPSCTPGPQGACPSPPPSPSPSPRPSPSPGRQARRAS